MQNDLLIKTGAQYVYSKGTAGNNKLPNVNENLEIGRTALGVPYFDSVSFEFFIGENQTTVGPFVNSYITSSTSAVISKTYLTNAEPVKQIIAPGDWEIIFNIKVFADFFSNVSPDGTTERRVHSLLGDTAVGGALNAATDLHNAFNRFVSDGNNAKYQNDYMPNLEAKTLLSFFNSYFTIPEINELNVYSIYLNDVLNIHKIVPYSINISQNADATNFYNVIINAYSNDGNASSNLEKIITFYE